MSLLLVAWMSGCVGAPWSEHRQARFVLDCAHAEALCESCHPADQPLGLVDAACAACHLVDRPPSHDPQTTGTCEGCHEGACGWNTASPHPPGFAEPAQHGVAANLQDPSEGDCRSCHGGDLRGADAKGCDDCHAAAGHPGWRTDCTYCHGLAGVSGAPPEDLDGETDPSRITFRAHPAHVDPGPQFRPLPCSDCHAPPVDVLTAGHAFDGTPGLAEVTFGTSPAPSTVWGGVACTNDYCHGDGQGEGGAVADGLVPLDCDGCHATTTGWSTMSGVHATHLAVAGVVCSDCHEEVIDRTGVVVGGARHVDGAKDVAFFVPDMARDPVAGTCEGSCHGFLHAGQDWAPPSVGGLR